MQKKSFFIRPLSQLTLFIEQLVYLKSGDPNWAEKMKPYNAHQRNSAEPKRNCPELCETEYCRMNYGIRPNC
jgi:hypothetical protein